jgi:exopolysaccharide biosynthesis protein
MSLLLFLINNTIFFLIHLINFIESNDQKNPNLLLVLKNIVKEKQLSTVSNVTSNKNRQLFFLNDDEIESSSQNNNNNQQQQHQQPQSQYSSILNTDIGDNFKVWHLLMIFLILWIIFGNYIIHYFSF